MRLIDADELITTILTNDLCDDDNIDKAILNAPTVESIPIKWIIEYANRECSFYINTEDTRCVLETMLEEWEKENETNR